MYRARARLCPGCERPMRELPFDEADDTVVVDRCDACGGVYLDFFDGEPTRLAHLVIGGHAGATRHRDTPAVGRLACPDCGSQMMPYHYLGSGPEVRRCETCMGLFASPGELRALAEFDPPDDADEGGLLARLRAVFARAVGR